MSLEPALPVSPPHTKLLPDRTYIMLVAAVKVRNMYQASTSADAHLLPEAQYSSSGVREQTAGLSSSFMSGSDPPSPRRPSHGEGGRSPSLSDRASSLSFTTNDAPQRVPARPDVIEERSEPVSPEEYERHREPPRPSRISALLQRDGPTSAMVPEVVVSDTEDDEDDTATEGSPLLGRERRSPANKKITLDPADTELESQSPRRSGHWHIFQHAYPSAGRLAQRISHVAVHPKSWSARKTFDAAVVKPALVLPAVFLGLLLNLLDALSYGIILFPLGEEVFSGMGPDGVSMFYVSCIVSQLVYSSGSIFRGGVGSEMVGLSH